MSENILVTGSTSPLGNYFVSKLCNKNNNIFTVNRRDYENIKIVSNEIVDLNKKFTNVHQNVKFDSIIHVASAVPSKYQKDSCFLSINYLGSKRLIESLNIKGGAKIFNISSSSVYDDDKYILDEKSNKTKSNLYGLSKLNFETFLHKYCENYDYRVCTVRVPVLLVKGVKNNFISNWVKNIIDNKSITIFNPNEFLNACVDAETIMDCYNIFSNNIKLKNIICNLGCENKIKLIECAQIIMKELNKYVEIEEINNDKKAQLLDLESAKKHGFELKSVIKTIKNYLNEERNI